MKSRKFSGFPHGNKTGQSRPEFFVFCEKKTGAARFKIHAAVNGKMRVDQAASLLAMHCLVRGESPRDYMVMVAAREDLLHDVTRRAEQLLDAGKSIPRPTRLSRRGQEVLRGVLQYLTNKEIAARLFISERTVKFHVSGLLSKFGVHNRMELAREANHLLPVWGSLSALTSSYFFAAA